MREMAAKHATAVGAIGGGMPHWPIGITRPRQVTAEELAGPARFPGASEHGKRT